MFWQITRKMWATKTWDLDKYIVYISVFYNISFSWLLPLDGFQLNFLCRFDSENEEFNLTHILEWAIIVWKLCSKCLEWECSRRQEFIENWQFLKYGYRIILNANLVNTEDQIWRPWQHIPFKTHPSTLLGVHACEKKIPGCQKVKFLWCLQGRIQDFF